MRTRKPAITVLTAPGERLPSRLDALDDKATLQHACSTNALEKYLPDSDILLVTDFRTHVLQQAWPDKTSLQWIHATSAGVDAILFPQVVQSDIIVTNARGLFDAAIAEYVLGAILAFAKDTRGNIELQQQRRWQHRDTERVAGKRLLVIGAGSIGHAIARLCKAAGMRTEGIARSSREGDAAFGAIHATNALHDRLPEADYVVIAAPLTATTKGLFNAQAFAAMPSHARLINVGRGPIVQTDALVAALESRTIAGAALDVFEQEPLPENHPLWRASSVLMSAHMAGDFIGWRDALIDQFLQNFDHWQSGLDLFNIIDTSRS